MKQWYGNYMALIKEPTQEEYKKAVQILKEQIPKEHKVDWETFRVIYKTPEQVGDLPYAMDEGGTYIGPVWTIAMKYQAEVEEE